MLNLIESSEHQAPVISIIIPVYNSSGMLDKCLTALSHQTIKNSNFEALVIDNASDTPPTNIIKKYTFAKYYYEKKPGSYAARNKGISIANSQYIAFLDADCLPKKDWLEKGIKALNVNESLIGGEVILTTSKKPTVTELYQYIVGFQQKKNIEEKNFSVTANLFIRKQDAIDIGPFDERLLSGGDRDWCWRACDLNFNIQYCPELIVETPARKHLRDAITQTRRVAGGRLHSTQLGRINNKTNLIPHRTSFQSIVWIFSHPKLSSIQKIQVFFLASFLKSVSFTEKYRLLFGSKAERI